MRQRLLAGKTFAALGLDQSLRNQARTYLALWPGAAHGSTIWMHACMPISVKTLKGSMDLASILNQLKVTLKCVSGPQCSTAARRALRVTGSADDLSRYGVPLNAQV